MRTYITLRQIDLRGSNLDTFVAEEQGYLAVHFARLGSLVVSSFFRLGPSRHLFQDRTEPWYRRFWTTNHQPWQLGLTVCWRSFTKIIDQWLKRCALVSPIRNCWSLDKICCNYDYYLKRVTYYYFNLYQDLAH